MEPTPKQMEQAVAALMPYVNAWSLPLNPDDLTWLAAAVIRHFDADEDFERVTSAEEAQIAEHARRRAQLYKGD